MHEYFVEVKLRNGSQDALKIACVEAREVILRGLVDRFTGTGKQLLEISIDEPDPSFTKWWFDNDPYAYLSTKPPPSVIGRVWVGEVIERTLSPELIPFPRTIEEEQTSRVVKELFGRLFAKLRIKKNEVNK